MRLRHSARSDVGQKRDHNEDDFGVGEGSQVAELGGLFVVCDGMGGHAAGEVASRIAVETILASYYSNAAKNREDALEQAFQRANERIYNEGRGTMGTTGVAALFYRGQLYMANVGDSRAYLLRDGIIQQVSVDHSLVGEQLAAGAITAEEARSLAYRNVITRALGHLQELEVDLFALTPQDGDSIVLCSDGLHGLVEDQEIAAGLAQQDLAQAVEQLVDLANERGGIDNITLLVIQVDDVQASKTIELISANEAETSPADDAQAEAQANIPTQPLPVVEDEAAPVAERRLTMLSAILASSLLVVLIAIIYIGRAMPGLNPATPEMIIPATIVITATPPAQTASPLPSTQPSVTLAPTTPVTATVVPIVPTMTPQP